MDALTTKSPANPSRLLGAISGEGFLFRFPVELGTPELLQLALRCGDRRFVTAFSSPSARHIAETFAQGLWTEPLAPKLQTLPEAQRLAALIGANGVAYFSTPFDDARLVQLSLLNASGAGIDESALQRLATSGETSFFDEKRLSLCQAAEPAALVPARTILLESPSHAVRCELLRSLPGSVELAAADRPLVADPAQAMNASSADWGVWIDAEGCSLQVFDRSGVPIPSENLLESLAVWLAPAKTAIVVEKGAAATLVSRLKEVGFRVARSDAARGEMVKAIRKQKAVLGGGGSGRIWFGGEIPLADAVFAVRHWAAGACQALPGAGQATLGAALSVAAA